MKQILQNIKNGETNLAEIPVPAVRPGCLLIKTSRSLISLGTERMLINFGKAGWIDKARQQPDKVKQVIQKIRNDGLQSTANAVINKLNKPIPLGYSNAGTVIAVGPGVTDFKEGDRVASNGCHAEVVCVSSNLCAKIPDNVTDTEASFTVVASIALEGVRLANPTLGEYVAVMGLGLVGMLTCQILAANGCKVIGFDFDEKKVELAKKFCSEAHCINEDSDPVDLAKQFSRQNGVDAVIITAATSSSDPAHQAPQMCRKRGRVVLVGVIGMEFSRDDFYKKEISFQVSCSYGPGRYDTAYEEKGLDYPIGYVRWTEKRNFEAVLDLMSLGKLATKDLVTEEIDFANAHKAYSQVTEGSGALGLVLKYDENVDTTKKFIKLGELPELEYNGNEKAVMGFIGAGNYAGGTLIPAFKETGAVFKTISSSGGVSGTVIGSKYGFSISTTDYKRVLNDPVINTVAIATRHSSHAKMTADALNSHKNVFTEKPLALNLEEIKTITEAYRQSIGNGQPLHLMVGYNRRFSPLSQAAQDQLRYQTEPRSIIITVNAGQIPAEHWTQDKETGGGRIIGEACHFIDLVRFFAGSKITDVHTAFMNEKSEAGNPPDTAIITLTCQNGSIGVINYFSNGTKDFPKERIEIFCGGKIIQIDNFRSISFYGYKRAKNISLWAQDKGQKACAQAFINSVEKGLPTPISIEELLEVAQISIKAAEGF